MAYRPHPKNASVDINNPRAWATCDRTGFVNNHYKLRWQREWAGPQLINIGVLVREQSLDKPQPQFKAITIPPDPKPIFNARTEPYSIDESGPITTLITSNAAAGATVLSVQSVTGFSVSGKVYVYLDNGGFWLVTVTAIDGVGNTLTISVPLPSSVSINQIVSTAPSDVV